MKQFFRFTIISTKLLFRSREALGWNMLFPISLFLIYVTAFGGMYGDQFTKEQEVADSLAKILVITFMSGGLLSLGISIAVMKEKGILRRYRVTPVRPITIVMGLIIGQLLFMLLVAVILFAMAFIIYNADVQGDIFDWLIVCVIGIFVFLALGFVVGGIARTNQGAAGIGNLLFMPMMFLSGATIPAFLFPKWLIKISNFLPATHLTNLLEEVLFMGNSLGENLTSILVLLGFGVVFVIIAIFLSRWN